MTAKKATATKKAAETAMTSDPVKTEEPAKAEKPVEKAVEVKAAVKAEEPVKKTAAKKDTVKKTTAKKTVKAEKAAPAQNIYVQFAGKEIPAAELVEKASQEWVALGHRASSIKSLDLYIKPEDMAAYYVINGKESGKISL